MILNLNRRPGTKGVMVWGCADKGPQAICAFANDLPNHQQPGVLFIGVDDRGNPKHLAVTDQLLLLKTSSSATDNDR